VGRDREGLAAAGDDDSRPDETALQAKGDSMKALTVCQPWAWAIIHAPKRIENRTWRTSHRGPLAVHAGLSQRLVRGNLPDGTRVRVFELVYRAIVGVVDCVPVGESPAGSVRGGAILLAAGEPPAVA
jgi:hypothetical protein